MIKAPRKTEGAAASVQAAKQSGRPNYRPTWPTGYQQFQRDAGRSGCRGFLRLPDTMPFSR